MKAIKVADGIWAIEMPFVEGQVLEDYIRLHSINGFVEGKAADLQKKAFEMLDMIDVLTRGLVDRQYNLIGSVNLESATQGLRNFILTPDGGLVNGGDADPDY